MRTDVSQIGGTIGKFPYYVIKYQGQWIHAFNGNRYRPAPFSKASSYDSYGDAAEVMSLLGINGTIHGFTKGQINKSNFWR